MVFRKHTYPGILTCERCETEMLREMFLVDGDLPLVCKECLTDSEISDYMRPEITKVMIKLKPWEKVKMIRRIMKDREVIVRVKGSIHK